MRSNIPLMFCAVLLECVHLAPVWSAHPVSHTDAWGKVSSDVVVRLNVFLDDVVRHQLGDPAEHDRISAESLQNAIRRHGSTLLHQLRIFDQDGIPLTASVTAQPRWQPHAEYVNLSENSLLKLTWKLQYSAALSDAAPPTALCFLHQFTHPNLTAPGELRLHLQHAASGKRIDSNIPPGVPHTIILPRDNDGESPLAGEVNLSTSRLVIAPTGTIHEFTAPLLMLDAMWPAAERLRLQASSPDAVGIPTAIDEGEIAQTKSQIEAWMRRNVQLRIGDFEVAPHTVAVEIFPGGQPFEEQQVLEQTFPNGVPLFGTLVGVRMMYPRTSASDSVALAFLHSPGPFTELNAELTMYGGRSSRLVEFATEDSAEFALRVAWDSNSLIFSDHSESAENIAATTPRMSRDPLTLQQRRPGWRGFAIGLGCLSLIWAPSFWRRRSLSRLMNGTLRASGICALIACAAMIPDSTLVMDAAMARTLVSRILTDVYKGTMQPSEVDAVSKLSEVLHEDLVEDVYLATLRSLSSSPDNGLFIDIGDVRVDVLAVTEPLQSPDVMSGTCEWTVRGIVHHWGHSHPRELKLTGEFTLIREGDLWKIRSISQTQSPEAT